MPVKSGTTAHQPTSRFADLILLDGGGAVSNPAAGENIVDLQPQEVRSL